MKYRFKIINYLLGAIMLMVLFHFVNVIGVEEIRANLKSVGWNFLFILICYLLSSLLATAAWKMCFLNSKESISNIYLLLLRLFTESVALVNPISVVGGDALKIYYLKKKSISKHVAVNSVLVSRLILITSQVLLMILVAIYFTSAFDLAIIKGDTLIGVVLGSIVLLGLLFSMIRYLIPGLVQVLHARGILRSKITFLRCVVLLQNLFHRPLDLILIFLFSTLHWVVGGLELYLILYFVGADVSFVSSLIADISVSTMKVGGAFIPGQIGVEEFSMKFIFTVLGIASGSVWITASIIRRLKQVIWIGLGLIMFSIYHLFVKLKFNQIGSFIRHT